MLSSSPLQSDEYIILEFVARVSEHAEIKSNPFPLVTNPLEFILTDDNIYCYNLYSGDTCSGIDGRNCTCITKLCIIDYSSI